MHRIKKLVQASASICLVCPRSKQLTEVSTSLFYTQGDYGLFQSTDPSNRITFDNEEWVIKAMEAQGFVENDGWHAASAAYSDFLRRHEGQHILFLEIGVGANTPVIIKYPFWQMTNDNPKAVYACLNYNEALCPRQIEERSLCIDGDSGEVIEQLMN